MFFVKVDQRILMQRIYTIWSIPHFLHFGNISFSKRAARKGVGVSFYARILHIVFGYHSCCCTLNPLLFPLGFLHLPFMLPATPGLMNVWHRDVALVLSRLLVGPPFDRCKPRGSWLAAGNKITCYCC